LILETARRLVKKAVNDLMRTHHCERTISTAGLSKIGSRRRWDRSTSTLPSVEGQLGEKFYSGLFS